MNTNARRCETFGPVLGSELGDPAELLEDLENLRSDLLDVADAIKADNRELALKYLRRLHQWDNRMPQTWLARLQEGAR
jgi:hypothetical protein